MNPEHSQPESTETDADTSVSLEASFASLSVGRSWLQGWADDVGIGFGQRRDEMQMVLMELLTNAIEASASSAPVVCELMSDDKNLGLRVMNANPSGNPVEIRKMPEPYALRGRGLALAQEMSDHLEISAVGSQVDISAYFNR